MTTARERLSNQLELFLTNGKHDDFTEHTKVIQNILTNWSSKTITHKEATSLFTTFFAGCKRKGHAEMGYVVGDFLDSVLNYAKRDLAERIDLYELLLKSFKNARVGHFNDRHEIDPDSSKKQYYVDLIGKFSNQVQNRRIIGLYIYYRGGLEEYQKYYKEIAKFGEIDAVKQLMAWRVTYTEFSYRYFSGDPRANPKNVGRVREYLGMYELLESYKKSKSDAQLTAIVQMFTKMDPQDQPDMLKLCTADRAFPAVARERLQATLSQKKAASAPEAKALDAGDAKVEQSAQRSQSPQRLFAAKEKGSGASSLSDADHAAQLVQLLEQKQRPIFEGIDSALLETLLAELKKKIQSPSLESAAPH